ncbi:MAG: AraC family transcriptional regulator [Paludibacter sp.]
MKEEIKYCEIQLEKDKSFYFDHVHIVWNEQITLHQSPTWELSYVMTGSGTRIVGDRMETFSAGEVVFLPPNIPHGWYFDEFDHDEQGKIENITIIFPVDWLHKCIAAFPETEHFMMQIEQYKDAVKFEGDTQISLQNIMTRMLGENSLEHISSLLNILNIIASSAEKQIVGVNTKQNRSQLKMQEVARYMVNNYQEKIKLEDVAKFVGMNRSSFCSFFKREKGKSFFTALTEYRIDCSCLMLRETSKPVAEICYAVGFDDVPHYNRTFKKLKGRTPKDYRAKQLELLQQ